MSDDRKPTPGPWAYMRESEVYGRTGSDTERWCICEEREDDPEIAQICDPDNEADAALISAAPDMAEAIRSQSTALNACILYLLGDGPKPEIVKLARAELRGRCALEKAGVL